jgi:hypothetical protein
MAAFVIYRLDTNEVLRCGWCADGMEQAQAQPGEAMIRIKDARSISLETHWITINRFGQAEIRERQPMAVGIDRTELTTAAGDHAIITGCPTAEVWINGEAKGQVDDGTLEFGSDTPGIYTIELRSPAFLTQIFVIKVSEVS